MDKETEQRKELRWARILVKQDRKEKPSLANLLAGARSYELQLWWEIQPRVTEVYPNRCSFRNFMADSRGEEEERTRALGRVSAANEKPCYLSREWQSVDGHRKAKVKRGTGKGEVKGTMRAGEVKVGPKKCVGATNKVQGTMCAGVVKAGPKKSVGTTNNMGRSEREKGDKLGGPSGSVTGILGCQTGKWGAQNVCPNLGPIAGQSLNCNGVQNVWPSYSYSEVNDWDDEKVKETGKGKEKTEGVELFCLGSRQRREDMANVAKAL